MEELGVLIKLERRELGPAGVRWTLPGCRGEGYVSREWTNVVFPNTNSPSGLLIGSRSQVPSGTIETQSFGEASSCIEEPSFAGPDSVVAEVFTGDLDLTFPVPQPVWIGGQEK